MTHLERQVGPTVRRWDIQRDRFPLGAPTPLGTVDAPTYEAARTEAVKRYGNPILVLLRREPK